MFENIECEWPLFFCYLILDAFFLGHQEAAVKYTEALESVRIYKFQCLNFLCKMPSELIHVFWVPTFFR